MIFLTMDEEQIDIDEAERIYVCPEMTTDGGYRYVIVVKIGARRHRLVSTGDDFGRAEFHCLAINECHINKRLTRKEIYVN